MEELDPGRQSEFREHSPRQFNCFVQVGIAGKW
jgi:hypothetical protein